MQALTGKFWWIKVPEYRLMGAGSGESGDGILVKSAPQKALLLALANRADDHTWIAYPGYADLQRFIAFPRAAYQRAARAMEAREWLERIDRLRTKGRGQTSNAYWMHVDTIFRDCGEPDLAKWAEKQPGATWDLERLLENERIRRMAASPDESSVVSLTRPESKQVEIELNPVQMVSKTMASGGQPDQGGVVSLTRGGGQPDQAMK